MDRPEFVAGTEEKFLHFIKDINKTDKIVLVSHKADLDGMASARITSEVVHPAITRFVDYDELNENLVKYLEKEKATKVIFTDLNLKKKEDVQKIETFAKVIIIDHHQYTDDFNSDRTVFMNAQGYCAGYLCYYLFSKVKDISNLDWLAACSSVSDWMFFKNQNWMSQTYKKYGDSFVGTQEGIKKGNFWDFQYKLSLALVYYKPHTEKFYDLLPKKFGQLGSLSGHIDIVQKEITAGLENFRKEKEEINGRYFWEIKSKLGVREIVVNILSHENVDKTLIVVELRDGLYRISARRQNSKENVAQLLKSLTANLEGASAGGHIPAAGGHVRSEDIGKFKHRLATLK